MTDKEIIGLYTARDESAVAETKLKYGGLMRHIARNIAVREEDAFSARDFTRFLPAPLLLSARGIV